MVTAGVVAEYNPFHLGHHWHLQETRRRGVSHIVAVMSGCYVQRGEPALWDKWVRTRAALLGGADLIIELPLPYACATAERFAWGAASLLHALGVVDVISFGCEAGNEEQLRMCAKAIGDRRVLDAIPQELAGGITYAVARQRAAARFYGDQTAALLRQPNNILGAEYLLALERLGSAIDPLAIPRRGAAHDGQGAEDGFASASFLRQLYLQGRQQEAAAFLPPAGKALLDQAYGDGLCWQPELLERPLLTRLRSMSREEMAALPDLSEGLENRLYGAVRRSCTVNELLEELKTKRYSHARLRRLLMSAFLGIPKDFCRISPPYLRVLGFNERGLEILREAKKKASLPLSHSLAELERAGETAAAFAALEARSTDLYHLLPPSPRPCGLDYTHPVIRV